MIGSSQDAISRFDSDLKKKSTKKGGKNRHGKRSQAPVSNLRNY